MRTGVYQIRNLINNKRYIGSTSSSDRGGFKRRERDHRSGLHRGRHHSVHLQRAWDKYGAEAFIFEILEICLPARCLKREQHYMDSLLFASCADQRFHQLGYNISRDAQAVMTGRSHTDSTKRQISQSKLGKCGGENHPMYGKNHSACAKLKNRKAHEKLTEEQVIQIKAMLKCGTVQRIIAERFQISQPTISYIKSGRIWSHIAGGDPLTR